MGVGLAVLSAWHVKTDISAGRLLRVHLEDAIPEEPTELKVKVEGAAFLLRPVQQSPANPTVIKEDYEGGLREGDSKENYGDTCLFFYSVHCLTKRRRRLAPICLMPNHVHLILAPATADGLARALGKAHRGASASSMRGYG